MARLPLRLLALAALIHTGGPAGAELAVLSGGGFLRVTAYEVDGERVRLDLASGGRLIVPLRRIERIVDDEVARGPVPSGPPPAPVALAFDGVQPVPPTPFGELIFRAARRHGMNPRLVAAVIGAESAFDPGALSSRGARGLMQLMPATARRFGVRPEHLFEPEANLEAGIRYLRWLSERFPEDLPRILAAYNAGEATVERYGGVPPFRETADYIRRIYSLLGIGAGPPPLPR